MNCGDIRRGVADYFLNLQLIGCCSKSTTVVERQTLNRGSPGSKSICCCFEAWAFSFTPIHSVSIWLTESGEIILLNSFCAITASWLNASQRSRVGVGTGLPGSEDNVKLFLLNVLWISCKEYSSTCLGRPPS